MFLVSSQTGAFGANDVLACKQCGGRMALTRRSPHPGLGAEYETQQFTCIACAHEVTRIVDEAGRPYEGDLSK